MSKETAAYDQLSTVVASVLDELLAIKSQLPEVIELRDRVRYLSGVVDDLTKKMDEKLEKGSMSGQVYYRDINNRLWLADSECANCAYGTGFDEPYLIRHGARRISLAGAIKLGWPATE